MGRLSNAAHLTAVVLTVLLISGCYTTRRGPIAPNPLPPTVEVELGGETVELHRPRLEGDELVGWQRGEAGDSTEVRVAYVQEQREFSLGRTALLVVPIIVGAVWTWGYVATRNLY